MEVVEMIHEDVRRGEWRDSNGRKNCEEQL